MHLMNRHSNKNLLIHFKPSTIKRLLFFYFHYQTFFFFFFIPTDKDSGQKETPSQDDLGNPNPENLDNDVF